MTIEGAWVEKGKEKVKDVVIHEVMWREWIMSSIARKIIIPFKNRYGETSYVWKENGGRDQNSPFNKGNERR